MQLQNSDFITLHTPLTNETTNLINDANLEKCKDGISVLKALSLGATACSFGKGFLFALSAGGQKGVEMILQRMKEELRRNMILLGKKNIADLSKDNIAFRN